MKCSYDLKERLRYKVVKSQEKEKECFLLILFENEIVSG